MNTRYKFLRLIDGKIKSNNGDCEWKIGEWKHEDKIDMCHSGFHCSKKIWEAFSYVQGEILAKVEVKGESKSDEDKEVYTDMRIIRAWKWQKKVSVELAIYSAELCIDGFEKVYPNDNRPRKAIEAAKKWLLEPTKENQSAAWSAAWSARSAWSAAWSAAESAAESVAESARSAWSAAWSAARKKVFTQICDWFDAHLTKLEKYE